VIFSPFIRSIRAVNRDAFVEALCDVPAKPSEMMESLRHNKAREGT